ncbi:hypothetical protein F5146DRAFT_507267 [Armillaria mellea]|nr:hypothetical protein F5146DRAFT_507267 [Armillaria mellea]
MVYTPVFSRLHCEIYVSQKQLRYDTQAEANGIVINKCWPIRRAMVAVIILLHSLVTINVAVNWSYRCSAFIENGQSFWTVYLRLTDVAQTTSWGTSIAASMSGVLANSYIIWYCWMVWGRRRVVVVLPIFFLISATASKIIQVYRDYFDPLVFNEVFTILYISFTLATTLWCTLLIIYRILAVAEVRRGAEGRLRVYRHFIEVLVESSALYSISLILYLAFTIRIGEKFTLMSLLVSRRGSLQRFS